MHWLGRINGKSRRRVHTLDEAERIERVSTGAGLSEYWANSDSLDG